MFCGNCGSKVNDDAAFCPECGQKIEKLEGRQDQQLENPVSVDQQLLNSASADQQLLSQQSQEAGPVNADPVSLRPVKQKRNGKKIVLAILIICILLAGAGAGGYGIYRSIVDRNEAETQKINAEMAKEADAEKQAKKEKKEQKAQDKAREEAKAQLMEEMEALCALIEEYDEVEDPDNLTQYLDRFQTQKSKLESFADVDDQNLYKAGMDYCGLQEDYMNNSYALLQSVYELEDFFDDLVEYAAIDPKEYVSLQEYIDECDEYLDMIFDAYDAIEIPGYLNDWWEQVGKQMDVLQELLVRGAYSLYYEDPLRYQSFLLLNEHLTQKLLQKATEGNNIIDEVIAVLDKKSESAGVIYDEMKKVADKSFEERQAYDFSGFEGELITNCDAIDVIYPTLYNAIDQFAILELSCISGQKDVTVEYEIPGLTQVQKQKYHVNNNVTTVFLKPPASTGDIDLSSVKDGQMHLVITDADGKTLEEKSIPVRIMSKYDFRWISDEFGYVSINNILCFLTPESTAITKLKREAITQISAMTETAMNSFPGYQNVLGMSAGEEYVNTYLQAAGVMRALSEMNVRYNMDSFSSSGTTQHVMLPEEVLQYKSGLCIETALVVASALQSADLHTYLVLPEGHAQVAVETWSGSGLYFLIETTTLPNSADNLMEYLYALMAGNVSFDDALEYLPYGYPVVLLSDQAWENYVRKSNVIVIDCADSSLLGATPFAR